MSLCLLDIHGDIEGDYDNIVDLPKNATNGDILKELYRDYLYVRVAGNIWVYQGDFPVARFDVAWWDAPYEKGK